MRKDLKMGPGKLSAMIGHCCEAYWTNLLKSQYKEQFSMAEYDPESIEIKVNIPFGIWKDYVNGIFTKTVCEARNLNNLKKIETVISEINAEGKVRLVEGLDYGYINDKCLTDLTPENPDKTCTVGIWFRPLPDELSKRLSHGYKLYRD